MLYQNANHQVFILFLLISLLVIALIVLTKAIIEERKENTIEQEFIIVFLGLLIIFITPLIIGIIEIMFQGG